MEKQYRFVMEALASGRTVLVYDWPVQTTTAHVRHADRVTMQDNVLHIDGKPVI